MGSSMKKTFYYNFLPTKKEEMDAMANNRPYQVTRTLVEIREDIDPHQAPKAPTPDPHNPWRIRKTLETDEITTAKIHLSHEVVFEHIFRYSTLEFANHVAMGNKVYVTVCDVTDRDSPVMYGPRDPETFMEKGLHDKYVLGLNMAIFRSWGFKKDDEVGIYFDHWKEVFYFKRLS